jgi:hypothetical protein
MSKNTEYVSAMQAQMRQFDKDVDAVSAAAGTQARAAYTAQLKRLRESREAGQRTFLLLQAASESADARMHAGMQGAWHTMQAALKKVSADLKK